METSKLIEMLYKALASSGPAKMAKHDVTGILLNIIDQLELDGRPVTADAIKSALEKKVAFYTSKSNNEVA